MASLPTGRVTFLFADIEGSTALLQLLSDRRYANARFPSMEETSSIGHLEM